MASGIAPPVPVAERALPAGTRLAEYEIECLLAQSSIALVYQAYDRVLKLHVALQEYFPDALALRNADAELVLRDRAHAPSFESGRQAFVDEARMLAHCEHPSLPCILRILQHRGTAYRVMRCRPGPTLRDVRQSMPHAPASTAIRSLLDSLLGALAELHQQGWVHAAVSPANILMLADERPLLLDSHAVTAALISDRTRSMMAALEPGFAPIEQREPSPDQPLGPWTDLYSLAATLHFFVEGHWPVAPAAAAPPWLKALDACLAPSARDRPQSVAQLRALLESQGASMEAAGHRPLALAAPPAKDFASLQQTWPFIAARAHEGVAGSRLPAVVTRPARALPRRRRRWWAGAATLLLLTVLAGAGEWSRQRSASAAAQVPGLAAGMADVSARPVAAPAGLATVAAAPAGADPPEPGAAVAAAAEPAPAAVPDNPRRLCGTRSGYALYQCMQAQCAKRSWAQHAQCQRLRRDQSLG